MAVYAIVLTKTTAEVVNRIQKKFPHCYKLTGKNAFLSRSDDVSGKGATSIGLKGDDDRLHRVEKDLAVLTARVDRVLPDLATKKDLSDVKNWILKVGLFAAILTIGIVLAILGLFFL